MRLRDRTIFAPQREGIGHSLLAEGLEDAPQPGIEPLRVAQARELAPGRDEGIPGGGSKVSASPRAARRTRPVSLVMANASAVAVTGSTRHPVPGGAG
jgi:hypothetical protein